MNQFICIKHPKYRGNTSPVLSCSTCCSLYVQEIKKSKNGGLDQPTEEKTVASVSEIESTKKWLEKKRRESIKLNR